MTPTPEEEEEIEEAEIESVRPANVRSAPPPAPSSGTAARVPVAAKTVARPVARPETLAKPAHRSPTKTDPAPAPEQGDWAKPLAMLAREVEARRATEPRRAALLLAAEARIALDALGDVDAADAALTRASGLVDATRFIVTSQRCVAEHRPDGAALLRRARAELPQVGEPRERVALLWQIAALEEHVVRDIPTAKKTMRELLRLEPTDLGGWETLLGLHLRQGAKTDKAGFAGVVEAYEAAAVATGEHVLRGALQAAAGAMREVHLDDEAGAKTLLQRTLEIDPMNAAAQVALESLLLRQQTWGEYAAALSARAEKTPDTAEACEAEERAGDIEAECVGDLRRAAGCYERAAALAPEDVGLQIKLARVFDADGRWADAAAAYRRLVELLRGPEERAWHLVRLGTIFETRLNKADAAFEAYKRAVDLAPTFTPALAALGKACRERRMFDAAIDLDLRAVDRIDDAVARSVRYSEIAEQVEAVLNDPNRASELYERAVALDPSNAAAFESLDRLYRKSSQWPKLASLYENALAATRDPRRARALRLELAELAQTRAHDPARAADLYAGALEGPEDRFSILAALARAQAMAGRFGDHVATLEAQVPMLVKTSQAAALYRIATLLETRVKDSSRALATYETLLKMEPKHEPALRAVIRIHEQELRFDKVIASERRLLAVLGARDEAIECLLRIGRVAEEQLSRIEDAITAYTEAFERNPAQLPAVSALERTLSATNAWKRLADVLERFAEASPEAELKTAAFLRAGSILELRVGDRDRAQTAYAKSWAAATTASARYAACWGVARMQDMRLDWGGLDETLRAVLESVVHPHARRNVLVRLARNAELRLRDLPRAAALYEAAIDTGVAPLASVVDRVRIARLEGERDSIAVWMNKLASNTKDVELAGGLVRVLALESEYGDNNRERAAELYARLLGSRPRDLQALDGLVRCLASSGADAPLADVIATCARASSDGALRGLFALAAGIRYEKADRVREADAAYAEAIEFEPDMLPALDAMRRLRSAAGDAASAQQLAVRIARTTVDRENVADAWLDAAVLSEGRLGDAKGALDAYRALLVAQPAHSHAFERALVLLEASSDWGGAIDVLASYSSAIEDTRVRSRCLARRATILAEKLSRVDAAIADLRRAIELVPDEIGLVESLARYQERVRDWQEAVQLYERVAKKTSGPTSKAALLAQARIWSEELRDYKRAETILERITQAQPDDRDTSLTLASVAMRSGNEARGIEIYERLASSGKPAERAKALVAQADAYKTRKDSTSRATAEGALTRAFDLAITDKDVLALLEERAQKNNDWRAFVTQAEAAASRVAPATPGVLPLRLAIARAYREHLNDPEKADQHMGAAVQAFPKSIDTRLAYATALLGRNDEAAIVEVRRAVAADPASPGAFEAFANVLRRTGKPEVGAMLATAAALLGSTSPEVERQIANASVLYPRPDSMLPDELMLRLVGPTRAWFLRAVLSVLDPFLPKICPGGDEALALRARLPESYPLVAEVRAIAGALGAPMPIVCRGNGREVALLLSDPRGLVLGSEYATESARSTAAFHAAYACARMAANGSVYVVPVDQVTVLLEAATTRNEDEPAVRELRKRMNSALPRKNRKELEKILEENTADAVMELVRWNEEEAKRSLYAAVVLSRDLRAVAEVVAPDAMAASTMPERRRLIAANPTLCAVLEFVTSNACWDLFQRAYGRF